MEIRDRILDRVIVRPDSGCWIWPGSTSRGYGTIRVGRSTKYVHRLAYEIWIGPLPEDSHRWTLDHTCEVVRCANPSHLRILSRGENAALGSGAQAYARKKRAESHCKNGHEYTEETTGWVHPKGRKPYRRCLPCNRAAWARYQRGGAK